MSILVDSKVVTASKYILFLSTILLLVTVQQFPKVHELHLLHKHMEEDMPKPMMHHGMMPRGGDVVDGAAKPAMDEKRVAAQNVGDQATFVDLKQMKHDDHRIRHVEHALHCALTVSTILGITGIVAGFSGRSRCARLFFHLCIVSAIIHVIAAVSISVIACKTLHDHPERQSPLQGSKHVLVPLVLAFSVVKHVCFAVLGYHFWKTAAAAENEYVVVATIAEEPMKTVETA